ncbi:MAG TPA: sugar ABC transporter substrate-binding protein, partial [Hyphomicrobiales bacterium]
MKTLLKALASLAVLSLLGAGAAEAAGKGSIGISMPTKSSARWIDDGNNMVKYFKEAGYETDLQYAEDDIP